MAKPRSKEQSDRIEEVRLILMANSLTVEKFLEAAFAQSEVASVVLQKYAGGTPSELEKLVPGFDPEKIVEHVLEKYKAGKYRFSPLSSDGRYICHRVFALGDLSEEEARAATAIPNSVNHPDRDRTSTFDAGRLANDLLQDVRTGELIERVEDIKDRREDRREKREMRPVEAVVTMMDRVLAARNPPPADTGSSELMRYLIEEARTSRQMLMELLQDRRQEPSDRDERLDRIEEALEQGLTKATSSALGGGSWQEILSALLPQLVMLLQRGGVTAPVAPPPALPYIPPVVPPMPRREVIDHRPQGEQEIPMPQNRGPQFTEVQLEMLDTALQALETSNFPTVAAVLEMYFGEVAVAFGRNYKANPVVFMPWLRTISPKFEELREQVGKFLVYYGEKIEQERQQEDEEDEE